jgi:hypothetical protein
VAIITLQFETPQDFSRFKKKGGGEILETNIRELTITLKCTEELPAIAIKNMNAKVIKSIPSSN